MQAAGYGSAGHIDLPAAAVIASTGMITAGLGARAAHALNASTLQKLLGVFMLLVAPTVPLKNDILEYIRQYRQNRNDTVVAIDSEQPAQDVDFGSQFMQHIKNGVMFIGAGSGFLAGLFGVGGGSLCVVLIFIWRLCRCPGMMILCLGPQVLLQFRP